MKTEIEYFRDWESHVFGYGYGTGESYIIPALKCFFDLVPLEGAYDHKVLEDKLTPTVAWLLINALCKADVLEYGTSPRFAWFTHGHGKRLKQFIDSKTVEELFKALRGDQDYVECYPGACNCGLNGYEKGRKCANPFW